MKAEALVGLEYVRIGDLAEFRTGTYFDTYWATRRDGSSQGGHLQFALTRSAAVSEGPVPLVIMDRYSKPAQRISRVSPVVEAQVGVVAVAFPWLFSTVVYVGICWPGLQLNSESFPASTSGRGREGAI